MPRSRFFFGNPPRFSYYSPNNDVAVGNWTPSAGGTLFGCVDEAAPDDADYVRSGLNPSADQCILGLPMVAAPQNGNNCVLSVRMSSDGNVNYTVSLYCGGTLIASVSGTHGGSAWETVNCVLTPTQVAAIADFADLRASISVTAA